MQVLAVASLLLATIAGGANANANAAHNETRALQASSVCVAPEYHFDFPGNDYVNVPGKTPEDCCTPCFQFRECAAYTWTNYNGGTCWLKTARSRAEWKGANADGSANTVSVELNRCGHAVTRDFDIVGTDGGSASGVRPESCCQLCYNYRGCKGFSWNDYNGGTCWFKGGDVQMVYKQGVYAYIN